MSAYRNNLLFKATGLTLNSNTDHITAGTVNAVNGQAGAISVAAVSSGLLIVNAANAPGGSSPTLAVFFDVQDAYGNWCLVSNATAISGAVLTTSGTVYGQISTGYTLTDSARIRWVVGGTGSPSFTGVSFSLYGRP